LLEPAAWLEWNDACDFRLRVFRDEAPARAGLLVVFYLLYFTVIVAFSLGVSARARSSRLALVILLSFWFANSVVASRVAADVASWVHPTPSAVEFQQAMEADLNNPAEMQARLDRRKAELLAKYNAPSLDAVPVAFSGVSLQEGENHGDEVFDRHYGALFDTYDRQNRTYQFGGVLAPMLAIRSISMGLAGTDFPQHRHFVTAAEDYRRLIQRTMNADIMAHPTRGGYVAGKELWEKVPEFDYSAPTTGWVLANVGWSIGILNLWLVLSAAWMLRPLRTSAV
jgi:ABC-2 type transport system permease protein